MLDKPQPKTPFRKPFDDWWKSQSSDFQARTILQAGYTAGGRRDLKRFIFRAGRFKITIWADTITEARKQAIIEADYRIAFRGGKQPASGWKLEVLRQVVPIERRRRRVVSITYPASRWLR